MTNPNPDQSGPPVVDAQVQVKDTEVFFAVVYRRLVRNMLVLALLCASAVWWKYGPKMVLAFIAGCSIAMLNFHWLKRTVVAVGDRVANTGKKPSSAGVVMRFLFRYLLIAVAGYAIFKSSADRVYGLFGGLFLPVGAIFIEAVYAMYGALRRSF